MDTGSKMTNHPAIEAHCTPKQIEVFEQIAINNSTGHHPATVKALERKGLVVLTERVLRGHPPVKVWEPQVPLPIHMQWCQWCAEQPENAFDEG
jgi:hypothetical protein